MRYTAWLRALCSWKGIVWFVGGGTGLEIIIASGDGVGTQSLGRGEGCKAGVRRKLVARAPYCIGALLSSHWLNNIYVW